MEADTNEPIRNSDKHLAPRSASATLAMGLAPPAGPEIDDVCYNNVTWITFHHRLKLTQIPSVVDAGNV